MNRFELTDEQKAINKALANGVTPKAGTTLKSFRDRYRSGNSMVIDKISDTNAKKAHNNATLSRQLADEENAKIQKETDQFIADVKAVLAKDKARIFESKRNMVMKTAQTAPSDSVDRKVRYIQENAKVLSPEALKLLINDPEIATNYYASTAVQKVASENGIDYIIGCDPVKTLNKLDQTGNMFDTGIDHIGETDNYTVLCLCADDNPSDFVTQRMIDLDTNISAMIPAPQRTLLQRLKEAQKHAYDADSIGLSARIESFIERNIDQISSPEEVKSALLEQAEGLISDGMSAKKGE